MQYVKRLGQSNENSNPKMITKSSNFSNVQIENKEKEDKPANILSQNPNTLNNSKISNKESNEESQDSSEENNYSSNPKLIKEELKESKSKLKIITSKFSDLKKERDNLQKENKTLQEEVMTLQSSLRQMIPGFSNTGSTFPMFNELVSNISEFYKYDCEDIFFDLLCPELNMKGIILFYYTCFYKLTETIKNYFAPSEALIKKTACLTAIEGPILNVLRKSYQSTWKSITKQCFLDNVSNDIINEIQSQLKLGKCSQQTNTQIINFLLKMEELLISFYICDPPVFANYNAIGTKVSYNPIKHEPMDGFIKNKDECIIILPSAHKNNIEGELVSKALVLQINYEIPN